ncbi:MAG: (5-formylfuran-3-yl)methyl phosphate synthase [Oscillospiraceae bacterium]|jgi:uncharacterized protein (UPF0264 family)|nr:(5-formylfuran-3-yl)methyl phosphate synthase [Oscillospiraceae bacterium]
MISVVNKDEALIARDSKAELIDIKNPEEGSLGAQSPLVIKEIVDVLPSDIEISATVGDVPYLPCTIAQAAYAVASFGVKYVKIGFKGCKNSEEAKNLANKIVNSVKEFDSNIIIGCYADYKENNTLSPFEILEGVKNTGVSGILIDTLGKKGKNLFDYMGAEELKKFTYETHMHNLLVALAGSIKYDHIGVLKEMGADISGVRGAICDGDRMSEINPEKIKKFMSQIA